MLVSLAGGRPQMRKDKKADSRICGKTCLENRTVSSSLKRAFRQKAFRMPESAEGGLLAVFVVGYSLL